MEPRFPSSSSALPVRRSEIRRRSGGLSPNPENDRATCPNIAYSPSFQGIRHLKPVPYLPEDDPHRLRSANDLSARFPVILYSGSVTEVEKSGTTTLPVQSKGHKNSQFSHTRPLSPSQAERLYRAEPPLPPLPEETNWNTNLQEGHEVSFSPVPLTPRPDVPHRFPSRDSQSSKASKRSAFSLFPRLPTPDFTALKQNQLNQAVTAPLNFLRTQTQSIVSAFPTRSRPPSTRTASVVSAGTAEIRPHSFHGNGLRTESFEISNRSETSTLRDDDLYSSFIATAPSRFTRKFPSPAPRSTFGRSLPSSEAWETLVASESGNDLGVESIGRWTSHKWCLLFSVLTIFGYSTTGLICAILTWFGTWSQADVMWVADNDILIFITFASTLLLLTGLAGLTGSLLNSRAILAFYALLLWPCFVSILVVGYTSYKREAFSLDRKLNMAWSQWYDDLGRLLIQESLHCCGFYNPLHEATFSKNCYPRTPLPGCKGKLFRFERDNLHLCWRLAFSLVPLHILNITISLLCSNHVDRRFGKGLTPRAYRLSMADVRANADAVLSQFSDTKLPFAPSQSYSHVTDREDRPGMSRIQSNHEQSYSAIGHSFLKG